MVRILRAFLWSKADLFLTEGPQTAKGASLSSLLHASALTFSSLLCLVSCFISSLSRIIHY